MFLKAQLCLGLCLLCQSVWSRKTCMVNLCVHLSFFWSIVSVLLGLTRNRESSHCLKNKLCVGRALVRLLKTGGGIYMHSSMVWGLLGPEGKMLIRWSCCCGLLCSFHCDELLQTHTVPLVCNILYFVM